MSKPLTAKCRDNSASRRGAALIITLAFVVLLTGLVVAYFSRATIDRQTSVASFNNAAADLMARGALDIVVTDFKKEIANAIAAGTPTSTNIIPARSGNVATIPNLIRRSVRSDSLSVPSRASAASSTPGPTPNRGDVASARWNTHLLMPLKTPGSNDTTPIPDFVAPDWVLMTRNGPKVESGIGSGSTALYNSEPANAEYVIGRYAYAVYDEGGLLDANIAGYLSPNTEPTTWTADVGRKGVLAFADLTTLPRAGGTLTYPAMDRLVLFRNYATAYDAADPSPNTLNSTSFTTIAASLFGNYYLSTERTGTFLDFGAVSPTKVGANPSDYRTDQRFTTRSELLKFQKGVVGVVSTFKTDILQYLGTFSRERNKGTWDKRAWTKASTLANLVFPQRFFTGKLNDVSHNNKDFGLIGGGSNWQYVGRDGTTPIAYIPAITDVNKAEFFQILNYALNPEWDAAIQNDSNNIATTLAVGAALMDQYDLDANPTRIDYTGGSVYGIEAGAQANNARPLAAPSPPTLYTSLSVSRPFRNVGEFGYAYKQGSSRLDQTINFSTPLATSSPIPVDTTVDAGLLDFFSFNDVGSRSGIVNLNTRQAPVLAALLRAAIYKNSTSDIVSKTNSDALTAATAIVNETIAKPAISRADVARLASKVGIPPFIDATNDEAKETIARALAEVGQTRTWGLLIDLVAQTGRYKRSAQTLADFAVDGEKRYWLHIAIDRFDGTVLGQQLEEVIDQ